MKKGFTVPKAQPNSEASFCQYLALCQKKLSQCRENEVACSLSMMGFIDDKGTFTPLTPDKFKCPKLNS